MASRQQVRELLDSGLDYTEAGKRLGIPAGQVYLIATGTAADGGDAPPEGVSRPGALPASQEQEGTDTLVRLGKLEPDTDEFDESVEQLVAQLRKHVAYEGQVFTRLREAVPDSERERLGRKIEAAAKRGPTRPHRRTARKPAAAVKAAAGAAAADRVRDAEGSRPADREGTAG